MARMFHSRRSVLRWLLGVVSGVAATLGVSWTISAQQRPQTDLKDMLRAGLKARRPVEFAFIDKVVDLVEDGKLPYEMVVSTFHWARKNAKYKKYPFPYFEWALRERAKKIGVKL